MPHSSRTAASASKAGRARLKSGLLLALLTAGLPWPVGAHEPPKIVVSARGGHYRMSLDLVLHAPVSRVWHVITDYADIKRLNPAVKSSAVIRRDGVTLLRMRIKSCVLFICFPITQTESMTTDGHHGVRGVIVPQLSSFRSGVSRWQLRAVAGGTEAHFSASLTPSFYIPPVIGPWMVRRKLRAEMRATASHLKAWVYEKTPYKA